MLRNLFFIAFGALLAVDGLAQCEYTLSMDPVQLDEGELASASTPPLSGDLTSVTFNLDFSGTGASYPADMMAYIYAPNGECVVWGGWNIPPTGGCTDIGTGFANSWPNNWSTTVNGNYTYELPTAAWNLVGTGEWTITVQNAWTGSAPATYDLDVIFSGVCPGDCDDPVACNYVAGTTLGDPDLCEYAIDVYPSGYYDCDGNCYNDDDGDGVCNELEVAGCQVLWACNYNALATDPPPPNAPCTYPENDEVDCDGNSLLPQFLSQPEDATVSCNGVPATAQVNVQVAPAATAYFDLFPESCYDTDSEPTLTFTESVIPGNCPGNYTIQRFWEIVDCNGFENSHLQTIQVVDNLPPVVSTDLEPVQLNCNDPIVFPTLQYSDACGGGVSVIGQPTFLSLPGACDVESTEKKFTVISDQCGNETTVEQTLVFSDDQAPFWLNEPNEVIITDDIDGGAFDLPVANDICSSLDVTMSTTSGPGDCPLSTVLTRTFVAVDACGNSSLPFVQTIKEASDLVLTSVAATDATCHGGTNGSAAVTYQGGVGPYAENWFGFDPNALEAGTYNVQITDDNLCIVDTAVVISEPAPFVLSLDAVTPACNNAESGMIESEVFGGTGNVTIDWGGLNPNAVPAGEYTVVATDGLACTATASVVVPPAVIPEPFDLTGDTFVAQGDSAAYYYEYTLGSTYDWTFSGASEEEVLSIFAISLLWDSLGSHEVCVIETNQEGCSGEPVCLTVFVEDDVWNIQERNDKELISVFPNPAFEVVHLALPWSRMNEGYTIFDGRGAAIAQGILTDTAFAIVVSDWPSGPYVFAFDKGSHVRFNVIH